MFAFFSTPNASLAVIQRFLAHENLHTWIPEQVGGAPDHDEASDYWFSEGFTDFYTGRLLVRENIWSLQDFAEDWNTTLSAYAHSPVRTAPNTRIVADMWNDSNVHDLPYQRGRLLAAIWDARLRASGHSLDTVMRDMQSRASGANGPAVTLLTSVMASAGLDLNADIANFVINGSQILLPAEVFAPCGEIQTRQIPNFDRGFDIVATQANHQIIAGVDPSLPAYAAGLRNGMVLERRSAGTIGDSEHELAYLVRDGTVERTISYMPHGRGEFSLQTFVLDDHLDGERLARCRAVLAGS
jgi:predicted metalloprotease with PDZ domain